MNQRLLGDARTPELPAHSASRADAVLGGPLHLLDSLIETRRSLSVLEKSGQSLRGRILSSAEVLQFLQTRLLEWERPQRTQCPGGSLDNQRLFHRCSQEP